MRRTLVTGQQHVKIIWGGGFFMKVRLVQEELGSPLEEF